MCSLEFGGVPWSYVGVFLWELGECKLRILRCFCQIRFDDGVDGYDERQWEKRGLDEVEWRDCWALCRLWHCRMMGK